METHSYDRRAFAEKEKFVQQAFAQSQPKSVLDLGTNTGHFSLLAATQGAHVVAIDTDAASLAALWAQARLRQAKVLPLVVNLARPTPATGWRNLESLSFLERARGKFDLVLMLAVLHHLLVSERIPLDEILDLVAELATDRVIIEFVPPGDPMFQVIARGRDALFGDLTRQSFEAALQHRFTLLTSRQLPNSGRWLYLLARKNS